MTEHPKTIDNSSEFEFDHKSVAIVMNTYYPEYHGAIDIEHPTPEQVGDTQTVRANLAFKTAQETLKAGYNLYISDGGSNDLFIRDLHNIAGATVLKRPSPERAVGRRQGFNAAEETPGVKATILMESEKFTIIPFIPQIVKPIVKDKADIVVIGREDETFKRTWPPYMYEIEKEANEKWNNILDTFGLLPEGLRLHMWAGPRATTTKPEIMSLWKEEYSFDRGNNTDYPTGWRSMRRFAKPEQYSDAQYFPVITALYQRLKDPTNGPRVINMDLPFEYPSIQRLNEMTPEKEAEFRDKRKDQFYGFMVETTQFIRYLLDPASGKSLLHKIN